MRRLLRLALPLVLLAAFVAPTSAGAQVTVSTDSDGGLSLLASSPTALTSATLTGDVHATTATIDSSTFDIAASPGGVTLSGTTVTVTTTAPHSFVVGQSVTIDGVAQALHNGVFVITAVPAPNQLRYTNAANGLAASGGGTASTGLGSVVANNVVTATATTAAPNSFTIGQQITIAGASVPSYNGVFAILTILSNRQFTFTNPVAGLSGNRSLGGTISTATIDNLSVDARSVKVGSSISGAGIPAGAQVTNVGSLAGAVLDPLGLNNSIAWAARLPGTGGNSTKVTYVDPGGTTAALGASITGQDITVNLGRGEVGATGLGAISQNLSSTVAAPASTFTITPTGASESGNVVTIVTTAAHGLAAAAPVNLSGINVNGYNGNFTVSTVVNSTTFTVLNATTGLAASGNGQVAAMPSGASSAGTTATLQTTAAHALSVGQTVTVAGIANNLYNGTFVVTAIPTLNTFSYAFAQSAIAASPGGATEAGNTVTITTTAAHGLTPGQNVTIAGVGVGGYNGTFTVVTAPTPTTFTVTNPTAGLAASGGGTATPSGVPTSGGGTTTAKGATESGTTVTIGTTAAHNLQVGQMVNVSGVSVGGYNGDVYVTAVPTTSTFQYTAAPGLADGAGGNAQGHAISGTGATESGTTVTITTRAAHGLQVGQSVTVTGVPVAGYNGTVTVATVPTTTTFTYTAAAGLAASGGGAVYTVTTTAQNVIDAVTNGNGVWAAIQGIASTIPGGTGTVNGRLAANTQTSLTGGLGGTLTFSPASAASANGVALTATYSRRNSDLAFWGTTLVQGDDRGLRVFNIANPAAPALLSDFSCNGAGGDVSVYKNLVFRSVDRPQTTASCAGSLDTDQGSVGGNHSQFRPETSVAPGFEGIRIIDITNPASPTFVKGVATDCGSISNTLVPDLANNRVLLYISSFPNVGIDTNATTASSFGNTCKRTTGLDGSDPTDGDLTRNGHSKLTIVEVPLGNPASAHVLGTVPLAMTGPDPFFYGVQKIPGYVGDFSNVPGLRGCKDITVFLPKKEAAAACVTDGLLLDITNPAAPTIKKRFTNPYIDLCARGILRTTTSSPGPPNCMWNAAQFTNDGKYVMFSDLASGRANCTGVGTPLGTATCNADGNTQVGADRYYDGTATTNECEIGSGTALVRGPWYRGAIWVYDVNDTSFPLTSYKEPRWERYTNQGCSSQLMNIVPKAGAYLTPAAWHLAGVDVVNWTSLLFPKEEGYFDANTTSATDPSTTAPNATAANRDAGNDAHRSNATAAYWYNGHVYVSNDSPEYGDNAPAGSRGLEVFNLGGTAAAGALTLGHLNPQTQESLLKCSITVSGKFRVGVSAKHKITLKALGQGLRGMKVQLKGYGIVKTGTTGTKGGVTFKVKPKKATKFVASSADAPNMLGCKVTKHVAKKKKAHAKTTAHRVAFRPTALSRRVV
jgi:hypothetical protein